MTELDIPVVGYCDLREFADVLLESHRVEYVTPGVLSLTNPPGFQHRKIVRALRDAIDRASLTLAGVDDWDVSSENFQWELRDESRRFFVPDLVVSPPGAESNEETQRDIRLIVEVTWPPAPETVRNDREIKPDQYAKGGVPFYLLVDQELGGWRLHGLSDGQYGIVAEGEYGKPIELPEPFGFAIETEDWPHWPK